MNNILIVFVAIFFISCGSSDEDFDSSNRADDKTKPVIISSNPIQDGREIPVNTNITVTFSEEVKSNRIFGSKIDFRELNGDSVYYTQSYRNKVLTIDPKSNLKVNTMYVVTFKDIEDTAFFSNKLDEIKLYFKTVNIPVPTVVATSHNIKKADFIINFNTEMNKSTLNNTNIYISDGEKNVGVISDISLRSVSIKNINLDKSKRYTLNITTSVQNSLNTSIENNFEKVFHNDGEFIYSEVRSSNGTNKIWLDRNLGAKKVCSGILEDNCFGDYYQWGRDRDGHEKASSSIYESSPIDNIIPSNTDIKGKFIKVSKEPFDWSSIDQNGLLRNNSWNPCPSGFEIPNRIDLSNDTLDTNQNGKYTDTFDLKNANELFKEFLKLPAAGHKTLGNIVNMEKEVTVWTKSTYIDSDKNLYKSWGIALYSESAGVFVSSREEGQSVRCIKQ
ncbi:MAG: Ig-like domain-containing protein [Campylobacteraceae bacterium]|nr:Ig-like domain-containing protein [Campylobacteraceae bacterium]